MDEIHCLAHRLDRLNVRHRHQVHVRIVHVRPNAPKRQKFQKTAAPSPPLSMAESHMVICYVCLVVFISNNALSVVSQMHYKSSPPSHQNRITFFYICPSQKILNDSRRSN